MSYSGKMNNAGDGDDEEPNDDGSNSNIEGVPAQPPRPIVVSVIIAFSRLRKRKPLLNWFLSKIKQDINNIMVKKTD